MMNRAFYYLLFLLLPALVCCTTGAERTRMRSGLDSLNVRNRTGQPFTPADVQPFTDYFDRHGTANDRLLAHYLMGRAYHEQGEAPLALQYYQQAADCADTTAADCDYSQLSRVYSQMAWVYHQQLLLSYEIDGRRKASYYATVAGNIRIAAYEEELIAGTYILQNKYDSAEIAIANVLSKFEKHHLMQDHARASLILMFLYCNRSDKLHELGTLIRTYETNSEYFDSNHELHSDNRIFYYYKGRYYELCGRLDSAYSYYQKIYYPEMSYTMQNSMYKGLLNIFKLRNQSDSVLKYSQLYCEVNDSSIALKDQSLTAQLRASYDYGVHVLEAKKNKEKFYRMFIAFLFVVILCIIICLVLFVISRHYHHLQELKQKELETLKDEYAEMTSRYDRNQRMMNVLEETYQNTLAELGSAQKTIADASIKYINNLEALKSENKELIIKIKQLERKEGISDLITKSRQFMETPIVTFILEESNSIKPKISQQTWKELLTTYCQFYPGLISDLNHHGIGSQEMQAALLIALNIRTDSIALILKVSGQRITNIKASLNEILFGVKSARPLFENMKKCYGIFLTGD